MRKLILFAILAAVVFATPAYATNQIGQIKNEGGFQLVSIRCPSQATNAIDTTKVAMAVDPLILYTFGAANDTVLSASGDLNFYWPVKVSVSSGITGTGGSGSMDSLQVALDVSSDGNVWTEALALNLCTKGVTETHILKFSTLLAEGLQMPSPYLRIRAKNAGAATGRHRYVVSWVKGPFHP